MATDTYPTPTAARAASKWVSYADLRVGDRVILNGGCAVWTVYLDPRFGLQGRRGRMTRDIRPDIMGRRMDLALVP